MLNDGSRMRSGDMEAELSARVDQLIAEFMAEVDAIAEDRHLQRGIARSQLPSSMVAILDQKSLTIIGQFRLENRTTSYFHRPDKALNAQQASNSAQWEFGFDDPFIIQLPAELMDKSPPERRAALQAGAAKHIDSEYQRLEEKLSLMRTRPIFGSTGEQAASKILLLLLPKDAGKIETERAIRSAVSASHLPYELAPEISQGKAAVREIWQSINHAAAIVADLTGADATVMYALGIAHTLGRETVLVYPQGSKYLTDIPRTHRIEYEDSDEGRSDLEEDLREMLCSILAPMAED